MTAPDPVPMHDDHPRAATRFEALPAGLPQTPCVGLCSTTFDAICRGCGRSADEVRDWLWLDDTARDAVWRRLLAQGWRARR